MENQWIFSSTPLATFTIFCPFFTKGAIRLQVLLAKKTAGKVPAVFREVLAGICLGICGMLIPAVMFSGEEQMGVLMKEYSQYLPLALIGVAFLKVLLTNICIQFGLKGGHFFPVIFAGVCMGYGVGMLICGNAESHLVFASAIVTAALLGGTMKKPLAVTIDRKSVV